MTTDDLRRKMGRLRKQMPEAPPPVCKVCGHSVAHIPLLSKPTDKECEACAEQRREWARTHNRPAVVRVVNAPTREQLEAEQFADDVERFARLADEQRRQDLDDGDDVRL